MGTSGSIIILSIQVSTQSELSKYVLGKPLTHLRADAVGQGREESDVRTYIYKLYYNFISQVHQGCA